MWVRSTRWGGGAVLFIALATAAAGCGDEADDDDSSTSTGGAGATGGVSGNTGGNAGAGADGTGGVEEVFWTADYDPPPATQGGHNEGATCMQCHDGSTTGTPEFLFGGTLASAGASVEIGIKEGDTVLSAYSQNNGNFWADIDVGTVADWSAVEIRLRTATGEIAKPAAAPRGPDCNLCHAGANALSSP